MHSEMNKFWAYVTAFGTLWGGIELTLGTFLHVLHVPKTGFIMTLLTTVLLLAQRQIFSARGSSLAVGVIAACIKCLSPGGIVAGPVLGILCEAIIVELALMFRPRSMVSAIAAGSLTMIWSQIQSLMTIWIYYGQDFIDGLVKAISKFFSVSWTASLGWGMLGAFFGVIFLVGAVAGVIGWQLGRRANRELIKAETLETDNLSENSELQPLSADASMSMISSIHKGKKRVSVPDEQVIRTRKFMWIFALGSLIAQFSGDLLWSSVALAVWLVALFLAARGVLKAIWWPKFWSLTIVISVICGLILAWNFENGWNWMLGLEATARMLVRGVYVFSLICWATRCLRTREFLTIWERIHLPGLGMALANAYALLPNWLDRMNQLISSRPGGFRKNVRYARESLMICLIDAARDVKSS